MLNDVQKLELLRRFAPHGYQNTIFMRSLETRNRLRIYRAMKELEQEGLIMKIDVDTENGEQTRYRLTQAGMEFLFAAADKKDPFSLITEPENTAYRVGTNTEQSRREIQLSDIQTFMMSAGAESVYTLITNANQNPLIFGMPNTTAGAGKQRNFSIKAKCAIVDYVEKNKAVLLDPCVEADRVLFVPRTYNAEANKYTSTNVKQRSQDNHRGLLVDFVHKDVYFVLKYPRRSLAWQKSAYTSLAGRIQHILWSAVCVWERFWDCSGIRFTWMCRSRIWKLTGSCSAAM